MTFEDYLLHLFYLVDTELASLDLPQPLRSRGPAPTLADSEVITIELAGEFAGIDADKGIYDFFCRYHAREFPALATIDRTTFVRQAANLWRVKQLLHARIVELMPLADPVDGTDLWLVDSFPLRVCRAVRGPFTKCFAGLADYGRDPTAGRNCFFGFRVHLRASARGPVAQLTLAPASVADLTALGDLAPPPKQCGGVATALNTALGDRNYWATLERRRDLLRCGLELIASFKKAASDPAPVLSATISRLRQIIEVVIGQLATRFHAEQTRARDLWHLCARLTRKVLSHSTAVLLNWRCGNPPLQLHRLVTD